MGENTVKITVRLEASYVEFLDAEIEKKKLKGKISDRTDEIKMAIMQRKLSLLDKEEIEALQDRYSKSDDDYDLFKNSKSKSEDENTENQDEELESEKQQEYP